MLEVFGTAAVGAMALCYALEPRSPNFVLGFAAACAASSAYAVAIEAWPFAVIELLWSGLALRRFVGIRSTLLLPHPMRRTP